MTIKQTHDISKTMAFVKAELQHAEGGHDWFHVERVYKSAKYICEKEQGDSYIVQLAALLHDIADSKFYNGDETIGPKKAELFLNSNNVEPIIIKHIVQIIKNISFKGGRVKQTFNSIELDIVQDADRLDAMGAIGIARCFNYGGFKNRPIYNPNIKPNLKMTKEEYKTQVAPSINHFYEKLLLQKNKMNTKTGYKLAKERHDFMNLYLKTFYKEGYYK